MFERTSRSVKLTGEGEIFLGYAKRMIELQWEAYSRLREPDAEGEIRLGTPEDFATHYLPNILASFRQHHPRIQLSVSCDLTLNLLDGFHKGQFDLILVKRDPQKVRGGMRVWREPLVWVAAEHHKPEKKLSLALSPQPCIYRARALAALNKSRIAWQISYTSPSLAGTLAAVRAGLGITVLPANMIPAGLRSIRSKQLPELADAEIALLRRDDLPKAGEILAEHITQSLEGRAI